MAIKGQTLEHVLSTLEALGSIPGTPRGKKRSKICLILLDSWNLIYF